MHVRGTADIGSIVVGPLEITVIRALRAASGGIGNVPVLLLEQRCGSTPVPNALSPFGVSLVSGVKSKAGRQLEQSSVRNSVLSQITILVRPDLPAHATVAAAGIPSRVLGVEHTLSERDPGWLSVELGVIELGSGNGSQSPEYLIVVSEILTVIAGEEVVVAFLPVHAFLDGGGELGVPGHEPVQNEGHEHRATLPPGSVHFTGDILGITVGVEFHHIGSDRLGRAFEGAWERAFRLAREFQ